jgi:dihydroorotate dehydrogenase
MLSNQKPILPIAYSRVVDEVAAEAKMQAHARLLQLYTGFIYEEPGLVQRIEKVLGRR